MSKEEFIGLAEKMGKPVLDGDFAAVIHAANILHVDHSGPAEEVLADLSGVINSKPWLWAKCV